MASYTKLFSSIVRSSVWREADHVRLVWVTMLALADRDGVVDASIPGLAVDAGVTLEQCEAAIARLSEPDQYSRSRELEGRRIVEHEMGWRLVNHEKYRQMASKEEAKEKAAERQRRKRERHASSRSVTPSTACHDKAAPSPSPDPVTPLAPPEESRTSRKSTRRKPKVPIPADWTPNAAHSKKAATLGLNLSLEAEKFRTNAEGKDIRWVDWDKAFHNWLTNAPSFNPSYGKAPGLTQHEATLAEEDQALLHRAKQGEFGERAKSRARDGSLDVAKLKDWLREKNQRALAASQ